MALRIGRSTRPVAATAIAAIAALAWPRAGFAVDTLETYEPGGLTHLENSFGYQGVGKPRTERTLGAEALLGVGVTDSFSGYYYLGGREYDEYLSDGEVVHGFAVFATPLDTYHFDLDLELRLDMASAGDLTVAPAFEFNIDAHPDLSSFGLFLDGAAELAGRSGSEDGAVGARRMLSLGLGIGAYLTFAELHQVLVFYDASVPVEPEPDQRDMDVGGLAFGYNVMVHDQLELLHEVLLDVPQEEEQFGLGLMVGLIAETR